MGPLQRPRLRSDMLSHHQLERCELRRRLHELPTWLVYRNLCFGRLVFALAGEAIVNFQVRREQGRRSTQSLVEEVLRRSVCHSLSQGGRVELSSAHL